MKKLIVALAAVVMLSGCIKIDKSPPKDLPTYVHVYPGSTSVMSMSVAGLESVVFSTADKPDDVVTYYRSEASSDGLPETQATTASGASADQRQVTFNDPATGRMLVVVAKPQGAATMVSLTYKPQAKAAGS
jgi:hypothetical protein